MRDDREFIQPLPQSTRVLTVSKAMAQEAESVTALIESGEFRHHVAHSLFLSDLDNWGEFRYVCFDEVLIPEHDEIAVLASKDEDGSQIWVYGGRLYYSTSSLEVAMYENANKEVAQ